MAVSRKAQSAVVASLNTASRAAWIKLEQESCPAGLEIEAELRPRARAAGWPEKTRIRRLQSPGAETQAPAGDLEAGAQQLCHGPRPAHPRAEAGIVVFASPHLANERHHVVRTVRVEPGGYVQLNLDVRGRDGRNAATSINLVSVRVRPA